MEYYSSYKYTKLIEIDNENKKVCIILNRKHDILNIFDPSPYVNYNPILILPKRISMKIKRKMIMSSF